MEQLKLNNQLCFPFYTVSRLIIRKYKPHLDELGITYAQYLVLLVLWETDHQPVNDIAKKLYLQTNTITPLLHRLEALDIVTRSKDGLDERKVIISLTTNGLKMKNRAAQIPFKLLDGVEIDHVQLSALKNQLDRIIEQLAQS